MLMTESPVVQDACNSVGLTVRLRRRLNILSTQVDSEVVDISLSHAVKHNIFISNRCNMEHSFLDAHGDSTVKRNEQQS